jgi:acetolactate synthase-1/2/3 large subunit
MGLSYQSTYQAIKLKSNSRLITNTNFAPMGWGVCASIGICMGSEKINTILLTGDGGLMMNLQELATIAYHNLPIKVVIYNNRGYLTMKQSQNLSFGGRTTGVDHNSGIGFPDWEQIARGFGLKYVKVQNNSQLDENLIEVFSNRHPYIVDLNMTIDQPQIPRAVPLNSKATGFAQSIMENPYPFLPNQKVTDELTFLQNNNL